MNKTLPLLAAIFALTGSSAIAAPADRCPCFTAMLVAGACEPILEEGGYYAADHEAILCGNSSYTNGTIKFWNFVTLAQECYVLQFAGPEEDWYPRYLNRRDEISNTESDSCSFELSVADSVLND